MDQDTTNEADQPSSDVCRSSSDDAGCYPTLFTVNAGNVKARGYQGSTMDAFRDPCDGTNAKNINHYVEWVNVVYYLRKPSAGFGESGDASYTHICPCATTPGTPAHVFVSDHYYYESGHVGPEWTKLQFSILVIQT